MMKPWVRVTPGYRTGGWEVLKHIADGAWSSVYAARRERAPFTGPAALKFLHVDPAAPVTQPLAAARQEIGFHRQVHHRYVISSFGSFIIDDRARLDLHGCAVLSMELAAASLRERLAGAPTGAPLPHGLRMIRQVCEALAHVHGHGWVHGDLKPGNILLMQDGTVRVGDFGLAQELDGTHAHAPLLGTTDYLPPEWWTERPGIDGIDSRPSGDIWALGVTAHQILTGGLHPFPGLTARARRAAAAAYADGRTRLRLVDGLHPRWAALITDCLAPDHATRLPHSANVLLGRLRERALTRRA
jgi:serine/threonine protein kinase